MNTTGVRGLLYSHVPNNYMDVVYATIYRLFGLQAGGFRLGALYAPISQEATRSGHRTGP
jgi:hypothetical protein